MGSLVIEGLPCSGKSSIVESLSRERYKVIFEIGKFKDIDQMPGDGKSLIEILEIDDWFILQESKRSELINNNILDRYFFSHLTYSYAYSKLISIKSFTKTINRYHDAINSGLLKIPDGLLYISISPEISINRLKKKYEQEPEKYPPNKRLPDFWLNSDFLGDLSIAYKKIILCFQNVDTYVIDGSKEIKQLIFHTKKFYSTLKKRKNKIFDIYKFYKFLE